MAEQSLAYEDAARWFERAASLPELSLADRARMDLDAAANHVRAGDFARARAIYERLSAMDDRLIRLEAAVGYEDANWRPGVRSKAADLLVSALESCGLDTDDPRYVQALGSFGRALAFAGEAARAREIGNIAIDRARAVDDPAMMQHALKTSLWHGLTPEMCEIQSERAAESRGWRWHAVTTRRWDRPPTFRAMVSYLAGRPDDLAASTARHAASPSLRTTLLRLRRRVRRASAGLSARRLRRRRTLGRIALRTGSSFGGDDTEGCTESRCS